MILNKIFSGLFVQKLLMTCSRSPEDVFDFFQDVKNWESGGIITSVTKVDNDLWTCSTPAGKAKIKSIPEKESLILDHIFIVGDITWNVYVRILANNKGSTTVWTFLKPDSLIQDNFKNN